MLKLTDVSDKDNLSADKPFDDTITLPYEARQKSRLLSQTDKGTKIGIFLPRGQVLRRGLVLTGPDHYQVKIDAAPEALSVVRTDDTLQFAKACYHLGNRHVALQILPGELRYLSDHVLDNMLIGLGLTVTQETLSFEPENGAYHGHGH
jgi:urease accessory protein